MEATLGLRASPTACRTGRQLSSPKSAGTQVQLGRRSCFYFCAWESRSAVLCEYTKWLAWFLVVCTVCTFLAQAKLVLSSSAVQRIAYSAQYTQTGSRQIQFTKARVTKPLQFLSITSQSGPELRRVDRPPFLRKARPVKSNLWWSK